MTEMKYSRSFVLNYKRSLPWNQQDQIFNTIDDEHKIVEGQFVHQEDIASVVKGWDELWIAFQGSLFAHLTIVKNVHHIVTYEVDWVVHPEGPQKDSMIPLKVLESKFPAHDWRLPGLNEIDQETASDLKRFRYG